MIKKNVFLFLSFILFIISLILPSYSTGDTPELGQGLLNLILGPFGVLMGFGIPWLGNPLLGLAWILSRKKIKTPLILTIIGLAFAMSFLLIKKVMVDEKVVIIVR